MKSTKTIRLTLVLLWSIFSIFLVSKNAYAQTAKVSGTVINQNASFQERVMPGLRGSRRARAEQSSRQ